MKKSFLSILLIFLALPLKAQTETIVHDGLFGFTQSFTDDTITLLGVEKDMPAKKYGLSRGDKIIKINGVQVAGAGLTEVGIDNYMQTSGEGPVVFTILRPGIDSLINITVITELNKAFKEQCYFDYLVDTGGNWTIEEIAQDSMQDLFLNPFDTQVIIHSVEKGSMGEEIGLMAGDRVLGIEMWLWDLIGVSLYYSEDTILKVLRDTIVHEFKINREIRHNLGINSQLKHDLQQNNIWLRVVISNRISEDREYLMNFDLAYDTIIVYEPDGSGDFLRKVNGMKVPLSEKNFVLKDYLAFKVNLLRDEKQTFYINIKSTKKYEIAPYFTLQSMDYISKYDHLERVILGGMWGMMLIIVFYYIILYIYGREKSHLFYAGFVISILLALMHESGFAAELLWPDSVDAFLRLDILIFSIPTILFLMFGSSYLNLKGSLKFWYKVVLVNTLILLFVVPFTAYMNLETNPDRPAFMEALYIIQAVAAGSSLVIFVIPSILRIRQKFKPAWHFLVANLIFLLLMLYYSVHSSNVFNEDISVVMSSAALHIGVILQFLIFSLGLAQKMRATEREKKVAQEKMIDQLKENEKLKDKVNRELEDKVRERTREIVQQTAEIEAQRDELERQRDVLSDQKQEITDSINYAKRIQTAVLPPEEEVQELLPENFILFRPRDIVSGDFYWIRQVRNFTVIAAADCTGHGVPGAFMSMLGVSFLNEIVSRSRFDSAGEFLNRLRKKVKETLKQEGKNMEQKDGMDMAMAIIDNDSLEMQFAGAFNPMYIIRQKKLAEGKAVSGHINMESDQYVLLEIKGDRQPIAIHSGEKDFTTHNFKLLEGDTIYLFSDGFQDQMGGPKGKKFMTRKFKELLLSIQTRSMSIQKETLDRTLEDWMGSVQQIDDILVIGIRW